jgi:hypothetical protein
MVRQPPGKAVACSHGRLLSPETTIRGRRTRHRRCKNFRKNGGEKER